MGHASESSELSDTLFLEIPVFVSFLTTLESEVRVLALYFQASNTMLTNTTSTDTIDKAG
jgi:hypothetical protein